MELLCGRMDKDHVRMSAALSNKVYNLESGKYHVKTVFSVTIDGKTTDYTVYNTEKSV